MGGAYEGDEPPGRNTGTRAPEGPATFVPVVDTVASKVTRSVDDQPPIGGTLGGDAGKRLAGDCRPAETDDSGNGRTRQARRVSPHRFRRDRPSRRVRPRRCRVPKQRRESLKRNAAADDRHRAFSRPNATSEVWHTACLIYLPSKAMARTCSPTSSVPSGRSRWHALFVSRFRSRPPSASSRPVSPPCDRRFGACLRTGGASAIIRG